MADAGERRSGADEVEKRPRVSLAEAADDDAEPAETASVETHPSDQETD